MISGVRAALLVCCVAVMSALALLSGASGAAETIRWLGDRIGSTPLYITLGVFIGVVATTALHRARQVSRSHHETRSRARADASS